MLLIVATLGEPASPSGRHALQQPTVNGTHIVLVYAGDLWIVAREGGAAERLTAGVGEDGPHSRPTGRWWPCRRVDGLPGRLRGSGPGGVPRRLTYSPGRGYGRWLDADGKRVLVSSSRESYVNIFLRLYTVDLSGASTPCRCPWPSAAEFARRPRRWPTSRCAMAAGMETSTCGGQQDVIWIARLSGFRRREAPARALDRQEPDVDRPQSLPVRSAAAQAARVTLFAFDTKTKQVTQCVPPGRSTSSRPRPGPA